MKLMEKFTLENYTIIFTVKFGECGELQQGWITWESDGSDIPSAEEADRAWNASRVPVSFHTITRHREGSRRRVVLGGRGELERGWTAWESDGSCPKRRRGRQHLERRRGTSVSPRDRVT